jgi:hypothetical protein
MVLVVSVMSVMVLVMLVIMVVTLVMMVKGVVGVGSRGPHVTGQPQDSDSTKHSSGARDACKDLLIM